MERVARLEIWVRRHRLSQTVSAERGTEGVLEIFGLAMDRGEHCSDDSTFDCKEAEIMILTSQALPENLSELAKQQGVRKTLGSLTLLKGIEPAPPYWEQPDIPGSRPIVAEAWVDDKTFQVIIAQLASADIRQVVLSQIKGIGFQAANLSSHQVIWTQNCLAIVSQCILWRQARQSILLYTE
jgi:hypothetical protein